MSWAEFKIRLFAFKRIRSYELDLFRVHAYHAASGGMYAFSPKHFPKSLDKFWKVDKNIDLKARSLRHEILRKVQEKARNGKVRSSDNG